MNRNSYYPTRIGDQIVWLRNYINKVAKNAVALALSPAQVAATSLDAENAIYGLNDFRGALAKGVSAGYALIEENLHGEQTGNVTWSVFPVPTPIPATVVRGCVRRIFDFIEDEIKAADGYTKAIGADLGVIGPESTAADAETTAPEFSLRLTTGGKLEVRWKKGAFSGVKLEIDLGSAGMRSDFDLSPHYTLNWLPPAGQSAVVRVRLIYLRGDMEFGQWSDWKSFTLAGV